MGFHTLKRGDTEHPFTDALLTALGATDLSGATVRFLLKKGPTQYSWPAEITDEIAAGVQLTLEGLSPAFPTEVGAYSQEWEVTFSDGSVLTFPSNGHNTIKIVEDLNS